MNSFSKNNPNECTFNFNEKEVESTYNANAEPFRTLPNDYLFFRENKYQRLFCIEEEINVEARNPFDHSYKCLRYELFRREEPENSFALIDFKTDNIAQNNLEPLSYIAISECEGQDPCNKYDMNEDYKNKCNRLGIEDGDNQITQTPIEKQEIDRKLIEAHSPQSKKRGPRRMRFSRWGKEDDKRLYKLLLNLINNNQIPKKFIEKIDDVDVISDIKEITIISEMIKWKNSFADLIKRIHKILNSNILSIREAIALRKIVKTSYTSKSIDFNHLMQEFPGKSQETLERECEKILRSSNA